MDPLHPTQVPQSPFTKAGVAGGIGCASMWCALYLLWPLYSTASLPKGWGTLICLISFAIPYAYFKRREGG
jgi:hypothetical protein